MQTAVGFVRFMGKNGVGQALTYINMDFKEDGLKFDNLPCQTKSESIILKNY